MAADNLQQDMTQFTQIYSLVIPAGIRRDGTQFQNNQFTDGVWCRFQRKEPKKIGGFATLFTSFSGIYRGMINIPYNGINYVFAGNANGLDVFTTGITYGGGSGPYTVNMLPGSVFANVTSNTVSQIIVPGNATTTFAIGTEFIIEQTGTPDVYTITGSTYAAGPPAQTTIDFTPNAPLGTIAKIWLNDTIFTPDSRNNWQFDSQFSPFNNTLSVLAHPGKTLQNIDSGVESQVLVGNVFPDANNEFFATGLCDSTGQDPTYTPISVDGGVCVLYPFIFAYGSHGLIANNNVNLTLADYNQNSFYDWNGTFANINYVSSSKIVKGIPMRGGTNAPAGLFWATDSLIRVSFNAQAAQFYWNYDIVSSQISIMSSNAIVEMDGVYFWMGVDRYYLYNASVKVLPNDKNVNYLFDNINYAQRQKVWATKIPRYNEIWFFYPRGTATECTDAIIYNVKDDLWYDAGQAIGARRSCGYTTELFPTPIWAGWEYNTIFSNPAPVIPTPEEAPEPASNQLYFEGDLTGLFRPGSTITISTDVNDPKTPYTIVSSVYEFSYNATLITTSAPFGEPTVPGTLVYPTSGGYTIWQHEHGMNEVTLQNELAVYSSITTSDISWLTGTPSQESVVGINRRMHLRRIEPNFLQSGVMSMTILGRKFASGPYEEISGPFYFNQDVGKIDLRVEHRLVRLKFESNDINGNYEMGRNLITAEFGDERP